ncbi:scabin-related ADP-ribosyltransferase [Serratia liquefaciens]|uniref:scabin-related ADP-ribosyltransferase n=1 Tax=Serratia liquefaciens TaxID=614 RepID=UPI0007234EBF|nr:hypothetical protein [Serratia liquefaciens]GAK26141.1 hypothetical protein SLIQ_05680 [Serratia liquefaciens FK01]
MKRIATLLISILISSLAVSSQAALSDPPKFVYRVDSRSNDIIFREGFRAWGQDYNIVAHINGATCSSQRGSTSGFISTAADFDSAQAIANEHVQQGRTAYLYTIRADNTFYSGPASVDLIQRHNPLRPLSIMSLEMARRADEWDAVDVIPPENIQEVHVYRTDGTHSEYTNARYLNVDTSGNPSPYTGHMEEVLEYYDFPVRLQNGFTARLSSCFASCLGASNLPSSSIKRATDSINSVEECANEPEKVINYLRLVSTVM